MKICIQKLFILITLTMVSSCIPDSLTKFEESPPQKRQSQGGSTNNTPEDETPTNPDCAAGSPENTTSCPVLGSIEYVASAQGSERYQVLKVNSVAAFLTDGVLRKQIGTANIQNGSENITSGYQTLFSSRLIEGNRVMANNEIRTVTALGAGGQDATKSLVVDQKFTKTINSAKIFMIDGAITTPTNKKAILRYVDEENSLLYVKLKDANQYFLPGEELDSGASFQSTKATIADDGVEFAFKSTEAISINATLKDKDGKEISIADYASGGITFKSTPEIDDDITKFSINETNGTIQSSTLPIPALSSRSYLITAENANGSVQAVVNMRIETPPSYLSYSQNFIIDIGEDKTSTFIKGGHLSSANTQEGAENNGNLDPNNNNIVGKVLFVPDSQYLYVKGIQNFFDRGMNIDNSINASSNISDIRTLKLVSFVAEFAVNGYLTANHIDEIVMTTNGKAKISYVDVNTQEVYLNALSGTFSVGDTISIDNNATSTTITKIKSDVVKLTLQDNSGDEFYTGAPITNYNTISSQYNGAGRIINVSGTGNKEISVSVTEGDFRESSAGQPLVSPFNPYSITSSTEVTSVSHENHFQIRQGINTPIYSSLLEGDNVLYLSEFKLPDGLTVDKTNGQFSGATQSSLARTQHTISAINSVGITSFDFTIRVASQMQLVEATYSMGKILHEEGALNNLSDCKITEDEIDHAKSTEDDFGNFRPIVKNCTLDAGELTLHNEGFKLRGVIGSSTCAEVNFAPYYYFNWPAIISNSSEVEFDKYEGDFEKCMSEGLITNPTQNIRGDTVKTQIVYPRGAPLCAGDHSESHGPNCDSGNYKLYTHKWVYHDDEKDPDGNILVAKNCTFEEDALGETIECGGNPYSCIDGSVKDVLAQGEIEEGFLGIRYDETNNQLHSKGLFGDAALWEFKGKISSPYNIKLANFSRLSSCINTNKYNMNVFGLSKYSSILDSYTELSDVQTQLFDAFRAGHPFYTLECKDFSGTLNAKIFMTVREWDKGFTPLGSGFNPFAEGSNISFQEPAKNATGNITTIPRENADPPENATYQEDLDVHLMDSTGMQDISNEYYNSYFDWDDVYTPNYVSSCSEDTAPIADWHTPYILTRNANIPHTGSENTPEALWKPATSGYATTFTAATSTREGTLDATGGLGVGSVIRYNSSGSAVTNIITSINGNTAQLYFERAPDNGTAIEVIGNYPFIKEVD